jgi:formylglycine-generating enzyme required for sulfatase activity
MITTAPVMNYLEQLEKEMVPIKGSDTFQMDSENYTGEKRKRKVKVSDFHLCKYPVTQGLWEAVMGENPSYFKGTTRPVESVSWDEVQFFLEKLNQQTGEKYRLPSEAEWEYAARGGNQSKGFIYAGGNKLKEVGWYDQNSHSETKPVGMKVPNELGLYDMSGNVWEWCADVWHNTYEGAPKDGSAWLEGGEQDRRVVRGGSWDLIDNNCRVSFRDYIDADDRNDNIGFRLARY